MCNQDWEDVLVLQSGGCCALQKGVVAGVKELHGRKQCYAQLISLPDKVVVVCHSGTQMHPRDIHTEPTSDLR